MRILKLLKLAPLVLGISCATGTIRPVTKATDANTRIVKRIWYSPGIYWLNSGWDRGDLTTPVRVVISQNNEACITDDSVDEPSINGYYSCPAQWRVYRRPT